MKASIAIAVVLACLLGGMPQSHAQDREVLRTSTGMRWLYQPDPVMPQAAIDSRIEGHVDLVITIALDGTIEDASVQNARPAGIFEEAALEAVRQWVHEPVSSNGVPTVVRALIRVRFELPET